ncbi:MAG TPA: hypothetical protein VGG73_13760 [Vicinamibacterales bacterium]|jgi:hypothetical protein
MVTNYPQSMAHNGLQTRSDAAGVSVLVRMRQAFCGLHGHDTLLHFEQERMSLRCVSCGHETPGWSLDEAKPTVTVRGDARRHRLARPQLVSDRRIA